MTLVTESRESLARIRAGEHYDLILCDVMMPNLSGIDVYNAIAEINAEQAHRIVFMTGGAFTPTAQEFLDRPDAVHIAKPFAPGAIRALADRYLP